MNITRKIIILCLLGAGFSSFAQGTITTFRLDGLIISKSRYDSLRITRAQITKVRSLAPSQGESVYGDRGRAGVAEITTNRLFVVKTSDGRFRSASDMQDKESLLSAILEDQIIRIRNIDSVALQSEFGLSNEQGAIAVYLR